MRLSPRRFAIVVLVLLSAAAPARATGILYAVANRVDELTSLPFDELYAINPDAPALGTPVPIVGAVGISGLAWDGSRLLGTTASHLYAIGLDGMASAIGAYNTGGVGVTGLEYVSGVLYATVPDPASTVTPQQSRLWSIDPSNATGTNLGPLTGEDAITCGDDVTPDPTCAAAITGLAYNPASSALVGFGQIAIQETIYGINTGTQVVSFLYSTDAPANAGMAFGNGLFWTVVTGEGLYSTDPDDVPNHPFTFRLDIEGLDMHSLAFDPDGVAPVPEPGTLSLAMIGLGILGRGVAASRRSRNRA